MSKTPFRTQFNGVKAPKKSVYEKVIGTSDTIPDQTMSIKEIMRRYAQGLPITGQKVPLYDPEDTLPDIRTLDLSEIQELAEEGMTKRHHAESEIKEKQSLRDKARAKAQLKKELEEDLKKDEKNSTNTP